LTRLTQAVSAVASTGGMTCVSFERDVIAGGGIEVDAARLAREVAGRAGEVLAFPLVHVGPDSVAIGAVEFGVEVDDGLDVVVAGGNVFERVGGIAGSGAIDDGGATGGESIDVNAEERCAAVPGADLADGLGRGVAGEGDEDASGDGAGVGRGGGN